VFSSSLFSFFKRNPFDHIDGISCLIKIKFQFELNGQPWQTHNAHYLVVLYFGCGRGFVFSIRPLKRKGSLKDKHRSGKQCKKSIRIELYLRAPSRRNPMYDPDVWLAVCWLLITLIIYLPNFRCIHPISLRFEDPYLRYTLTSC